jgi:hypothetical protein
MSVLASCSSGPVVFTGALFPTLYLRLSTLARHSPATAGRRLVHLRFQVFLNSRAFAVELLLAPPGIS